MRRLVIGAFVLALLWGGVVVSSALQKEYPTVPYKKAGEYVGQIVWVEGTVLKSLNEPEGTYLCFHSSDQYLRVLVPNQYLGNFEGSLQHRYVGKRIKAIGKVDKMGSFLVLGVNEPKRIRIVEETKS